MPHPRPLPNALAWLLSILTLSSALGCQQSPPSPGEAQAVPHDGLWELRYDNDSLLLTDGNYSSGIQLGYLTKATERMRPGNFTRRINEWLAPLPGLDRPADEHFVGYHFGQLIFTPENLKLQDPGPEALPYTGLLYFNIEALARGTDTLDAYNLLVGVTGEPSLAEETQKTVHHIFGQAKPHGWSHQSRDELILNVGYQRQRRSLAGRLGADLDWDLSYNTGAALGSFFSGLNAGLHARLGPALPNTLGSSNLFSGFEASRVPLQRPAPGLNWHAYADLGAYAIARYLPVDGNLLQNSRSTDGEALVGALSLGINWDLPSFGISLGYLALTDTYEAQEESTQVGSLDLRFY